MSVSIIGSLKCSLDSDPVIFNLFVIIVLKLCPQQIHRDQWNSIQIYLMINYNRYLCQDLRVHLARPFLGQYLEHLKLRNRNAKVFRIDQHLIMLPLAPVQIDRPDRRSRSTTLTKILLEVFGILQQPSIWTKYLNRMQLPKNWIPLKNRLMMSRK